MCGPQIRLNRCSRQCAIARVARATAQLSVAFDFPRHGVQADCSGRADLEENPRCRQIDSLLKDNPFKDGTAVIESTPARQALVT
jgi:hypothetical protein